MKRLLYVLDKGIGERKNKLYTQIPNYIFLDLLKRNYTEILVIGQKTEIEENDLELSAVKLIELISKFNILRLIWLFYKTKNNIDEVICFGINGIIVAYLSKLFRKKYIIYIGGSIKEYIKIEGKGIKKVTFIILDYFMKYIVYKSEKVHYCNKLMFELYPTKGKYLICSSVFIKHDLKNLEKRKEKIKHFDKENKIKLGIIGYVHNNIKGIDLIIKAMKLLPKNIELEIVGGGKREKLINLAKKNGVLDQIRFKGVINDREELFNWLDSIDIYLQPSRTEGLPRATIEAMSRACPVISSEAAGGLKYLIDKEFLIEKEDYTGLKELILKMIKNKDRMLEQAQINFEKVEEFTEEKRDHKFYEFYSKI